LARQKIDLPNRMAIMWRKLELMAKANIEIVSAKEK